APRRLAEPRRLPVAHPGDAVQHLAAVVRGHTRPLWQRPTRGAHRVAHVLARRAGDVLSLGFVGSTGLGARERAADEQLVGLLDGQPAHVSLRYGSSPLRPPSPPKADSLSPPKRHSRPKRAWQIS